jgi:nitrite reductase/ring-hydroxylating ferredoxin subunit
MESPGNATNLARFTGVGKSSGSHYSKITIARGSHAFVEANQSRCDTNSLFAMKASGIDDDTMTQPSTWSARLDEIPAGHSKKFHILWRDRLVEGFVVNFEGNYYAYVNHCIHAGTPLDWWPNEFFSDNHQFLRCGTHGSLYEPNTGKCAGGPCTGGALFPLQVQVTSGRIIVTANCNPQK